MNAVQYYPATLVEGSECYVVFSVRHPETGKMVPRKKRFNRIKNRKHRLAQAKRYMDEVNAKLLKGWNPFLESTTNHLFTPLLPAVEKAFHRKLRTGAETTHSTLKSNLRAFQQWIDYSDYSEMMCSQFHSRHAIEFMEWVFDTREIGAKSYNNYLITFRAIFNHLKKRGHFSVNPFTSVDKMREAEVKKEAFSIEDQRHYAEYIRKNDYDFYICSSLVYYCALRNSEITRLKVGNILDHGFISVPGTIAKTDRYRMVQIPEVFFGELFDYVAGLPKDWYLFGEGIKPAPQSPKRIARSISERFARYREKLKLPKNVTFYALKDTGGERLIESGFNPKQIRDYMGHTDLAMTDKYIKKRTGVRDERLYKEFPSF